MFLVAGCVSLNTRSKKPDQLPEYFHKSAHSIPFHPVSTDP